MMYLFHAACCAVLMCFFVCGIGSFLVPRSDFSPSPLYELSPYRRGGCSSIARQSKE